MTFIFSYDILFSVKFQCMMKISLLS